MMFSKIFVAKSQEQHPRVQAWGLGVLIVFVLLGSVACAGYQPEGKGRRATAPKDDRRAVIAGDRFFSVAKSSCDIPRCEHEKVLLAIQYPIDSEGHTGEVRYTKGEPTDCVRRYIQDAVAALRYEAVDKDDKRAFSVMNRTIWACG